MEEGRSREDLEARLARAEKQRAQRAQERIQAAVIAAQRLQFVRENRTAKKARLAEKIADDLEAAESKRQQLLEAERGRLALAHRLVSTKLQEAHCKERAQAAELHQKVKSKLEAAQAKRSALLDAVAQRAGQANNRVEHVAAYARSQQEAQWRCQRARIRSNVQQVGLSRRLRPQAQVQQAACIKVQRAWCTFVREHNTTSFLATKLRSLKISRSNFATITFDQMVAKLQSRATLCVLRRFLVRAARKLGGACGVERQQGCPHYHAKVQSSTSKLTPATGAAERVCARVLLSAFMVDLHPQVVLSERGEHEPGLRRDAHLLVAAFDRLVQQCLGPIRGCSSVSSDSQAPPSPSQNGPEHVPPSPGQSLPAPAPQPTFPPPASVRSALLEFQAAWEAYLLQFKAWKSRDELCMEGEMVRAACAMESSMLTQTLRTSPSLSTANKHALEQQVARDHQLLRERIMKLTGHEGVARMESQLAVVRAEVVEAAADAACTAAPAACPSNTPAATASTFTSQAEEEDACEIPAVDAPAWTNERMVYELLHDPLWQLPPALHHDAPASPPAQFKLIMQQAFWDAVQSDLQQRPPALQRVLLLVEELRDAVADMAPSQRRRAGEVLCPLKVAAALQGLSECPGAAMGPLLAVLEEAALLLASVRAPGRDADAEHQHAELLRQLPAIDSTEDHWAARSVVAGLKFLFFQLRTLQRDAANAHLRALGPLAASDAGVACARRHFAHRLGLPPIFGKELGSNEACTAEEAARAGAEDGRHVLATLLTRTCSFLQSAAAYLQEVDSVLLAQELEHAIPEKTHAHAPATLRTGGRGGAVGGGPGSCVGLRCSATALRLDPAESGSRGMLLGAGLVLLTRAPSATPSHLLPETLAMEADRIEWAQNQFQLALVTAACCLTARQNTLAQVDVTQLSTRVQAMLKDPAVKLGDLAFEVAQAAGSSEEAARKFLQRTTCRSDGAFVALEAAMGEALTALVLLGGAQGRCRALRLLGRCGASHLVDALDEIAQKLKKIACVNGTVHSPWYEHLIEAIPV